MNVQMAIRLCEVSTGLAKKQSTSSIKASPPQISARVNDDQNNLVNKQGGNASSLIIRSPVSTQIHKHANQTVSKASQS